MSVFSFLEWIFGGSFLDGFGASTNGEDDQEGDGGTAGSGSPGKPPTS
jgi:hypothetical protein